MKTLLTGASGFIGRHVEDLLGNNCRSVYRYNTHNSIIKDAFYIKNIDNNTQWGGAFDGCESVIHLAGIAHSKKYNEQDYVDVNTNGTIHLASEAAKAGVKRFVFVSSVNVCGSSSFSAPFSNDTEPKPNSPFSRSKLNAELGLKKLAGETGLEVVIVRPTLVYGPNAPGNFGMLTKLVDIVPLLPFGMASNRRNFISVQNLADLLITCTVHEKASGHVFFGSERETLSIKDFTNAIASAQDKHILQVPISIGLMRFIGFCTGKASIVEQLFGNLEVDTVNLQDVLNWAPPHTMKDCMAHLYK